MRVRHQLLAVLLLPAVLATGLIAYAANEAAEQKLEIALGDRLSAVAASASTLIGPRALLLEPGDEQTRLFQSALSKLEALRASTKVKRILFVRIENRSVLLDTSAELKIGNPYGRATFDAYELSQVESGQSASSTLFKGKDGQPYKTGYAPLFDPDTHRVAAFVGVNAEASYYQAIDELRKRIGLIAILGFILLTGAALIAAKQLSVPLSRLSDAASAIGKGQLETPIPVSGPTEARVLAETMRKMSTDLRARDEEMRTMLAGIAHEVRNPLGGIELFAGLLKEDCASEDPKRRHADKILGELRMLQRVVDEFLAFARRTEIQKTSTRILPLISDVCTLLQADADARGVQLTSSIPENLEVQIAPEIIRRALLNLIKNAIQAAPKPSGYVAIEAELDPEETLLIRVKDNGPGVEQQDQEQIFRPFYTTKQKGTGLGLALVQKAAESHLGSIGVESKPGLETVFTLRIPHSPLA